MCDINQATRIAWKLRDVQHRQFQHIIGILGRYGLHAGQPRILHTVMHMQGATQREMAEKLQISPASLAMSLKRMQRAGLLEKTTDPGDQRANRIRLTRQGERVYALSKAQVRAADEQLLSGFTQDEIALLDRFLDRLYQNVEYTEQTRPPAKKED